MYLYIYICQTPNKSSQITRFGHTGHTCCWGSMARRAVKKSFLGQSRQLSSQLRPLKKKTQTELEIVLICSDNLYMWANYTNSLTWNKAIWEWFPVLTMISRSQWGRYNLHRYIIVYIYICWFRCLMLLNDAYNGYLGYLKKARAVSAQEHQAVPRPAAVGDFGVPLQILWCIFRGVHGKFRPFWDSIGKYWFVGGFTGIPWEIPWKILECWGNLGEILVDSLGFWWFWRNRNGVKSNASRSSSWWRAWQNLVNWM